jgi:hypothetical protein
MTTMTMMAAGDKGWNSMCVLSENEALLSKSQNDTLRRKPLDSDDQ